MSLLKHIKLNFPHLDAMGNARATDDLVQIMTKAYDAVFPELLGRSLVSIKSGVSPGAEEIKVKHFEPLGNAEVITDWSSYVPKVNVIQTEDLYKIINVGDGYDYSVQDLEGDRFSNIDTIQMKAVAARKAIEWRIDELLFYGHQSGLVGLTNLPGTNTHAAANPWSGVTWDVMLADLTAMVDKVQINTSYIEKANTMLIPPTILAMAKAKVIPDTGGQSVLQRFQEQNPGLEIIPVWRLENSGPSAKPQIIVYDRSPAKIESIIPLEFTQLPPQQVAFVYKIFCRARCGGIANYYPKSVLYGSGMVA